MKIVWDERKRIANLEKHGFDFAEIDEGFFESAAIGPAKGGRLKAVGWFDRVAVAVIFARLGVEAISLVSFRPAGATERKLL